MDNIWSDSSKLDDVFKIGLSENGRFENEHNKVGQIKVGKSQSDKLD
jgi:hypothetical protein